MRFSNLFAKSPRRSTRRPTHRRKLGAECLENRLMMAATPVGVGTSPIDHDGVAVVGPSVTVEPHGTISLDNGVLKVNGTNYADNIQITNSAFVHMIDINTPIYFPAIEAAIYDANGNVVVSQKINAHEITEIVVRAFGGNDTVNNSTALPSTIFGGAGNDNLYGGLGPDTIFGEGGRDGLFGGDAENHDQLHGGDDADRFLDMGTPVDNAWDFGNENANIWINSGNGADMQFQGFSENAVFEAGYVTRNDVILIDQALSALHHATGNTKLLKDEIGFQISILLQGERTSGPNIIGWNQFGSINISRDAFTTEDLVLQTVLHEFGHNWDNENPLWSEFMGISDWVNSNPGTNHVSGDSQTESWWYDSQATFARDYGKTSPTEDFATSFAAYFMDRIGRTYLGGPGATNVPEKMLFISQFLFSMSSHNFTIQPIQQGSLVYQNSQQEKQESVKQVTPRALTPVKELTRLPRAAKEKSVAETTPTKEIKVDDTLLMSRDAAFAEFWDVPVSKLRPLR